MVPSVTTVLQRFKTDWAAQLQPEAIYAACEAVGYTTWRDRLLNPVITVQVFLLDIIGFNQN
jgi:hypothetical protein